VIAQRKILLFISFFLFIIIVQASSACLSKKYKHGKTKKVKNKSETMGYIHMYNVKKNLKPSGLVGISDEQINDHWKLYQGYVKQVNILNQALRQAQDEKTLEVGSLVYADRRRRYGFEYNGMVLHEYYFENLASPKELTKKLKELTDNTPLKKAIIDTWGSVDLWKKDFIAAGKTRGIGWAILYCDPTTKQLTNHFIAEHQNGNIAGYKPILVMDVWEHAYMVDHKAGGRGVYIEAFLQNIDWEVVCKRFDELSS